FELSINKAFNENNFNKYNQNINKKQFINFILIYNLLVLLFYFSSLFLFLPYLIYILPIAIFFYFYKIIKLITDLIYFQIADLDNKFIKLLPHIIFIVLTFLLLFFLFSVGYLKQFSTIEIYHKLK
ncbi:MAG: hypothetical protein ACPL1F_04535, partial [bacterium]